MAWEAIRDCDFCHLTCIDWRKQCVQRWKRIHTFMTYSIVERPLARSRPAFHLSAAMETEYWNIAIETRYFLEWTSILHHTGKCGLKMSYYFKLQNSSYIIDHVQILITNTVRSSVQRVPEIFARFLQHIESKTVVNWRPAHWMKNEIVRICLSPTFSKK